MGDCNGFSWRRGLRNKVKRFICGYSNLCVRVFLVNSRWLFICDDYLRITALLECIIGIYKHEFTNKKQEI